MSAMSRRSFLSSMGAAIGLGTFGGWLFRAGAAEGQIRVRYEASSPQGLAMLGVYREAIQRMQASGIYPSHHPLSFRFQANTHLFPDNEPIDTEIFKLSGDGNDAEVKKHRKLALGSEVSGEFLDGVWATCPHHDPAQYFLPWHRLYLAYFEQIIEKVAGKPFSLPYWNYLDPKTRRLPEPFRPERVNGEANALYLQFRNPQFLSEGLNERIIDILQKRNIEAIFREPVLLSNPQRNGFSMQLESTLHDAIHGAVGMSEGMGSPEFAARDPLFYLHHANIDRIWESWRLPAKDGSSRRDPASTEPWMAVAFRFVNADVEESSNDISHSLRSTENLGFRYDTLEKVPPPPAAFVEQVALRAPSLLWESAGGQKTIRTPDDIVTVPLAPVQMNSAISDLARNPSVRYELSIDLNSCSEPGVYEVFLNGRERNGALSSEKKVGSFSLFSAMGRQGRWHNICKSTLDTTIRLDITQMVRDNTIDTKRLSQITIRPSYLSEKVNIVIRNVRIVAK